MARTDEFTIEQKNKGDDQIVFEVNANIEYAPNFKGIVLERPYNMSPIDRKDGWTVNPKEALASPAYGLLQALKLIDGIQLVEISNYWMRIKIAKGFKRQVNSIMLKVIEAIEEGWQGASIGGYSPYVQKLWEEFRFEAAADTFLPSLTATMRDGADRMVIEGTWEGFQDGPAFVSGFLIDSIARDPKQTDEWIIEMAGIIKAELPETITAVCSTPWRVNRTGKYEDGGRTLHGGKLRFDIKSGKGVIYAPERK